MDTQWNKIFKKGTSFFITIQNINDSTLISFDKKLKDKLTIDYLVESNQLIEDIYNTVYFKLNSPAHLKIIGQIIDKNTGLEVAKIYNQNNSIAKTNFLHKANTTYKAVFDIKQQILELQLPKASFDGFSLQKIKSDIDDDFINFKLLTNTFTLKSKNNTLAYAILHKKGNIKSSAPFKLSSKILTYNLKFLKTDLFDGLNTITIFNDKNDILVQRNFYHKKLKKLISL
ncbi:hypothetical protein [uncultured Olleya sp.]|uniref:hypothetical protein n=1 Tax=uncultured Olleya sp. TaxID=757243 RepID=UPI002598F6EA|nr:hypothetical protein [uncultured Olleya sp.]